MGGETVGIFIAVLAGMVGGVVLMGGIFLAYQRWMKAEAASENQSQLRRSEALTELKPPSRVAPVGTELAIPSPMPRSEEQPPEPPPTADVHRTLDNVVMPKGDLPWLEGVGGLVAGQKIVLRREENILGRSRVCDIQFHDPKVSRQHAMIRLYHGRYFIQDMQSSRGTLVNSQPVQTQLLEDSDQIRLGDTVLIFHLPTES